MLDRWTRWVIRHRAGVVGSWVMLIMLGVVSGANLSGRLTTSLAVPGTDSARADALLVRGFSENVEGTFTVVIPFGQATSSKIRHDEELIGRAAAVVPTAVVNQTRAVGGILFASIGTSLNLAQSSNQTAALRHALVAQGLSRAMVTGPPALNHDLTPILSQDLLQGEVVAVIIALALLLLVLGVCGALIVPFVIAAATTGAALSIIYLLSLHMLMVLYIPNVVELIGLGLAIDYSLLLVHRFRGEVSVAGVSTDAAVVRTMNSAGRTVILSAVTVAIGLATLLLVPVPFMRSLGVAGLVVPIVSLAAALSLQPALLSFLGARGVTPVAFHGVIREGARLSGAWASVARRSLARPRTVLVGTLAVLVLGMSGIFWLQLTPGSVAAIPQGLESAKAIKLVSGRAGPGIISPIEVVVDAGGRGRLTTTGVASAMYRLAVDISRDKESLLVAIGQKPPFFDSTGRYERMFIIGRHDLGNAATTQLVRTIRDRYIGAARFPRGVRVAVGGAPAQGMDFIGSVYRAFWWIAPLALMLAFVVLARALRSVLLALVAVLLDLLSVAVTFGLLVLVFRSGVGAALLGTYQVGQIEAWVPVFLFAMLFGLSMDYEVFIVTRMRESRDGGASTPEAITDGLVNTGAVVTAAALILVGALSGLVFGRVAGLQELGVGLSLGVLIDATLVRGLVLPSVMALLGDWNWWLPSPLARALRTKPSPR